MTKKPRRLPPSALVISVIALIVAVGGGTFAIASLNSSKVKKIANKQITKRAAGLSVGNAAELGGAKPSSYARQPQWALVDRTGTILAQSGGITINTTMANVGEYFLDFPTSLAKRPVSVVLHYGDGGITGQTSASPCGGSSVPGGFDCTNPTGINDARHLFVRTEDNGGASAPFGFYVTVGN